MNIYQYYNNRTKSLGWVFGLCEKHFLSHTMPPECDLISLGINDQFSCKHCHDNINGYKEPYDGISLKEEIRKINNDSLRIIEQREELKTELCRIEGNEV